MRIISLLYRAQHTHCQSMAVSCDNCLFRSYVGSSSCVLTCTCISDPVRLHANAYQSATLMDFYSVVLADVIKILKL